MPPIPIQVGTRFNRLEVVSLAPSVISPFSGKSTGRRWNVQCDCGNERTVIAGSLRSGNTTSCGCYARDINTKHGLEKHPLYGTWKNMNRRCHDPKNKDFPNYSQRGITVCDEWRESISAFIDFIGPKPSSKHSLDRIDNDKGYQPGNVRWATSKQQAANTSRNVVIEIDGTTMILTEWAKFLKFNERSVRQYARKHGLTMTMVVRHYMEKNHAKS